MTTHTASQRWLALCLWLLAVPAHAGLFGGSSETLRDEGLAKLKGQGVKHLVVPYFKINAHTKLQKTAKSGGWLSGGSKAKAAMWVTWTEPDTALLQRVADQAWQRFETRLTGAGFTVEAPDKVAASAAFARINGSSAPQVSDKMISLAPGGLKVYDPMAKIDPEGGFMLGMANMNAKLEGDIAREVAGTLEGVAVVRVTLNLAPGDFDAEGSTHYNGSASASVGFVPVLTLPKSSPTVTPEITGIEVLSGFETNKLPNGTEFTTAKSITRVQLNTPIRTEGQVSRLEETTRPGEKAATGAVALLGALMGKGASLEAGTYAAHVDGEAFAAEADKQIDKLAEQIAAKIAVTP